MKTRHAFLAIASALALLTTTGCAVMRDQESVGAYVDDATLTSRVKAKFAENPVVSMMSITVETMKGTVQLSGFAKTADEKATAERLARQTSGVVAVRNDIIVRA
ncbi:MAG TPA: BON domain-containing protein [Burkholderiaceae bacterium]